MVFTHEWQVLFVSLRRSASAGYSIVELQLYESIIIQPTPYYCHSWQFLVNLLVYFTSNASEIDQYPSIFVILPIRSRLALVKWKKLRFKCENHISVV